MRLNTFSSLILAGAICAAEGATLEWKAMPGGGGMRTFGGWNYIVCEMKSGVEAVDGELVVVSEGNVHAEFVLPFNIPAKTQRRYFHYFQTDQDYVEASVRVNGRPVGDAQPIYLASLYTLQGIVEVGTGTRIDMAIQEGFLGKKSYARSQFSDLPGDPVGYDNAEWLIVSDVDRVDDLSFRQSRALRVWVETGGNLMVFLKPTERPSGVIDEILAESGVQTQGVVTLKEFKTMEQKLYYTPKTELTVATLQAPAEYVRWRESGAVLSAVVPFGWGRIGVCGVHPGLANLPVQSQAFWEFIGVERKSIPSLNSALAGVSNLPEEAGELLIPGEAALPISMGLVVVYLFAYLLVLGPGQRWLLKRRIPVLLNLVIFFLTLAVFTMAAQKLASHKKGNELWVKDLTIMNMAQGGVMRAKTYSSFFVPSSGPMTLALGSDVLVSPFFSNKIDIQVGRSGRQWETRLNANRTEATMNFRQWDTRILTAAHWFHPPRLAGARQLPEGLNAKLRKAVLVTLQGIIPLGSFDLEDTLELSGEKKTISPVEYESISPFKSQGIQEIPIGELENALLLLSVGRYKDVKEMNVMPWIQAGTSVLVGITEYTPMSPKLNFELKNRTSLCVVRKVLQR